ncbi:hypothetical protein bcgnr5378_06980 [Bacillus cereus]|uniref:Uncharacterized protein n=1 Tax=Bacillus cereus TaxID=1396 RepID=A0A164NX27_BACCE|nr:hypothetical protein [Bacillus cereus]KZD65954.1 hypothetical protein B4088_2711 [Bacillus cereus]
MQLTSDSTTLLSIAIVGVITIVVLLWNLKSNKRVDANKEKEKKEAFEMILGIPITYNCSALIHSHEFGLFEGCVSNNVISVYYNDISHHYTVGKGTTLSINKKKILVEEINFEENTVTLTFQK